MFTGKIEVPYKTGLRSLTTMVDAFTSLFGESPFIRFSGQLERRNGRREIVSWLEIIINRETDVPLLVETSSNVEVKLISGTLTMMTLAEEVLSQRRRTLRGDNDES